MLIQDLVIDYIKNSDKKFKDMDIEFPLDSCEFLMVDGHKVKMHRNKRRVVEKIEEALKE